MNPKRNKSTKIILLVLILLLLVAYLLSKDIFPTQPKSAIPASTPQAQTGPNFILPNYPLTGVPLFQPEKIDSFKFFVNDDPQNRPDYFDANKNYYNVVYSTNATSNQVFDYYRSLMTSINQESVNDSQIQGTIGEYRVSISHYGGDTDDVYLQVHLPRFVKDNPYFEEYPQDLVVINPDWIEHESSYGLLNQKGGQKEYTRYFSIDPSKFDQWIPEYQARYANQPNYSFSTQTGLMRWTNASYEISLTFSKNHGRIYLMIRHPL